jgi:GMP synthase (glutamine-hydrolysing)
VTIVNNDDPDSDYGAEHLAAAFARLSDTSIVSPLAGFAPARAWLREENADALVLSGSDRSVTEALPWMLEEEDLLRACVGAQVPVLAVCFAHQVLGKAFGADVVVGRKHIGLFPIVPLGNDAAFAGLGPAVVVPEQHGDRLSRVPDGFLLIATSDYCEVQAIRHSRAPVYGMQFHPCYGEDVLDYDDAWKDTGLRGRFRHDGGTILDNVARVFAARLR